MTMGNLSPPPPANNGQVEAAAPRYAEAQFDFMSQEPGDLGFRIGQVITLTTWSEAEDWWQGTLDGQAGMFPSNYVQLLPVDSGAQQQQGGDTQAQGSAEAQAGEQEKAAAEAQEAAAAAAAAEAEKTAAVPAEAAAATTGPETTATAGGVAEAGGEDAPKLLNQACLALFDFEGQDDDELSFAAGETLVITGELNGWYLGRKATGEKVGIFPSNYVQMQ